MADRAKLLDAVNVYLLDDDEAICESLSTILEIHGARVQTFLSISETRSAHFDQQPGILIFDVQLGDGLGHEFLSELRSRGIDTPVIFMSGRIERGEMKNLMSLSEAVLEKPVDGDDLAVKIAAIVTGMAGEATKSDKPIDGC
ncbi:response regulator [Jiella mangrovi]|uniref:Response regulator n=1 Tax=Jiella mangrovi TaxID=2821407 RepID=A0ABS4BEU2_9HYPH|nr:response regulator [Jiella mangrovi]MBP0614480.1 response regulator [Jiella mangrovi]